jgi:hypothetical protein
MLARLTFLAVAAFWVIMNVLLWRLEFGGRGGDTAVPPLLVWHKILTAPDQSSLSVYQKRERMGFCEISSGVGEQMAVYDEGKLPPDGLAAQGDYLLHLAGSISLGDFTNRIRFDSRLKFGRHNDWKKVTCRISTRAGVFEIASSAADQMVHIKMTSEGQVLLKRDLSFGDLQDPGAVIRALAGNSLVDFVGLLDASSLLAGQQDQHMDWEARRTRVKIGPETVPVYRLETSVLGHPVIVDVSTLGEVLHIDLPGDISARVDEWSKP